MDDKRISDPLKFDSDGEANPATQFSTTRIQASDTQVKVPLSETEVQPVTANHSWELTQLSNLASPSQNAGVGTSPLPDATQFNFSSAPAVPISPTELRQISEIPGAPAAPVGHTLLDNFQSLPISTPSDIPNTPVASKSPLAPRILKNRFEIEEILGAGGMGVVYKAKDRLKVEAQDREPYVAIKVLGEAFKAHPEAFISLQRESRKTQKIAHPNIVNVHDFDRDGDTVFMTMEYLEGRPLDKLISQYKTTGLPMVDATKILADICAALIYAHGQNIIHSDFKPGNIFVGKNRTAKVLDFGIARAAAIQDHRGNYQDDRTIFDAGNLGALTPAYASLEMLAGQPPDARDDIYALGCIAYELFSGQHPFGRKHADHAARDKMKPKRLRELTPWQWQAIEQALAFKRDDRIASVAAFWALFTRQKANRTGLYLTLLLIFIAIPTTYYFWPKTTVGPSEAQVRAEIEKKLRVELSNTAIAKLLADANFTPAWQEQLYSQFNDAKTLVGDKEPWLQDLQSKIVTLYLQAIAKELSQKNIENAKILLTNGRRFEQNPQQFASVQISLNELIAQREEDNKRHILEQVKNEAQIPVVPSIAPPVAPPIAPVVKPAVAAKAQEAVDKENYQNALASVNDQLACKGSIDVRDLDIAINKLRSINSAAYAKDEPGIISGVVNCITKIAEVSVSRADDIRKLALRVFNNDARLSALKFAQKDACSTSIAGLGRSGARAQCRDILADGSKAPVLVVVPAGGELKAFAIGKYEVTFDDINGFCQSTGQCKAAADSAKPATQISLSSAQAYLQWLSKNTGKRYRLPTPTEWVYAAKAGGEITDPNRNCKLNSRGIQKGDALVNATQGQQNAWGLVNYLGNAREWVGGGGGVMAAGGSYETPMENCTFNNNQNHDGKADNVTGFRVLRELTNG